ncbi:hypothetical protein RFI_09115 [Reticulomyxa filosa]|uniref:PARG catalytic Macro domain-containing protein n=1 Tax=Reticulomyxa filosa TaxID=46433 RepID=X6NPS7_RETFI|nr:hypothetical protein RFI_09115 [Reticulomyxa filosa]|eukprot:ETO28016.1 hypothetical protein RFI_09115 [Reticulomyxa filosa]
MHESGKMEDHLITSTMRNEEKKEAKETELEHYIVDFANAFIGGGVLYGGNCQEEILFCIYPECLVALLLCAKLEENEVIVIENVERFSNYLGYGDTLQYKELEIKSKSAIVSNIVCMDAMVCFGENGNFINQFESKRMLRELNKAGVGFYLDGSKHIIVTGNWGCGAFGGNVQLKALLQLMTAAINGTTIEYYSLANAKVAKLKNVMEKFVENKYCVCDVWKILCNYDNQSEADLFDFILKA